MKRFPLLVIVSLIAAGAIWVGYYKSRHTSSTAVARLLPQNTLFFVHLPDLNRSREEFHRTDLYQIWAEPTVQEFLQKPRSRIPSAQQLGSTLEECEALQIKDAFVALVTIESSAWKMVGGFRFSGDPQKAERIIRKWKSDLLGQDSKNETVEYQGHEIHIGSDGVIRLATVHEGEWFFAANDPEQLKSVLDRVDGQIKDATTTLAEDDVFGGASKRMPSSYVALVFVRIAQLVEKLMVNEAADQMAAIREIRSVCGATSFVGSKIHDTIFVGMPKLLDAGDLTRESLPIATKDAFLYAAGFLNLTKPLPLPGSQGTLGWVGGLQNITNSLASKGVTLDEWNAAFGSELSWIGEWPANAHWPALFVTLPVKDPTKARNILNIITTTNEDSFSWTHQEKSGVHYFSTRSGGSLFSFSPTIGLSDQLIVMGADMSSVESAMKRSKSGNSELAASRIFLSAERDVPTARQAFSYIDPSLIFTRADATLRPILLMGAAFVPGVSDTVDLNKLPAAEVITKHLSPIVMSQNYDGDGYIAESAGPITFWQTILGVGGLGGVARLFYHQGPRQVQGSCRSPVIPATDLTASISVSDSKAANNAGE